MYTPFLITVIGYLATATQATLKYSLGPLKASQHFIHEGYVVPDSTNVPLMFVMDIQERQDHLDSLTAATGSLRKQVRELAATPIADSLSNDLKASIKQGKSNAVAVVNSKLERTILEIDAAKSALQTWHDSIEKAASSGREDRSTLGALGLITGLFGTGLGLFNSLAIHSLKGKVAAIGERQDQVESDIRTITRITAQQENMIMDLQARFINMNEQARIIGIMQAVSTKLDEIYQICHELKDRIQEASSTIMAHRLPRHLIGQEELTEALQKLDTRLEEVGLQRVFPTLSALFQLPVDFISTDAGIMTIVHVPATDKEEEHALSLFRLMPSPIFHIAEHDTLLLPTPDREYLGFKAGRGYLPLSAADLKECQRYGDVHLCTNPPPIVLESELDCTASLYQGHWNPSCPIRVLDQNQPHIHRLSGHSFAVWSPNDTQWTIGCQDSAERATTRGLQLLTLDAGCVASNGKFRVTGGHTLGREIKGVQIKTVDQTHWPEFQQINTRRSSFHPDDRHNVTLTQLDAILNAPTHPNTMIHPDFTFGLVLLFAIVFTVVMLCCAVCSCKAWVQKRMERKAKSKIQENLEETLEMVDKAVANIQTPSAPQAPPAQTIPNRDVTRVFPQQV